jgi:uncharacterized membrane-anchored protein
MTTSRKTLLALAAVALVQTAVLAYMVIGRVQLLRTGREITLPIRPIDPRDLFRGEYVRLGYDISAVPVNLLEGPRPKSNEVLYVTLEKKEGGAWRAVGVTRALPDAAGPDRIVLKGRPMSRGSTWMRYGIESYFVPQGQGPKLEKMARDSKLAVLVAVDKAGNAAIKGLIIDGKLQYEEPLF